MSLGDTIRGVTGPLVKSLAAELGSTVTFRKATLTRAADNSSRRVWGDYAEGTHVIIESLNIFKAQQLWGMGTSVAAQALLPMTDFNEEDTPETGDGMVVTGGAMLGHKYSVGELKPDDLGQNLYIALLAPQDNDI